MPTPRTPFIQTILIGNPANRRVLFFQQALQRFGLEPAVVIPYVDLLRGTLTLTETIESTIVEKRASDRKIVVRIESPGEDFEVERRLIALGAETQSPSKTHLRISKHGALRLRQDQGRIAYPAQWFAGYRTLMAEVSQCLKQFPKAIAFKDPMEIITMFDKPTCHQWLAQAEVPVPNAILDVESFDDLRERMRSLLWNRVFVKLANGSSASGVIALYVDGKTIRAVTPMECVGSGARTRFYNNLKLRVYHRPREIRLAIDFLCRERAHVEQWLPKAQQSGRNFDLRIVTIAGSACQTVVRTSHGPITNLHLGNRRGDLAKLIEQMGIERWQSVLKLAERAAETFPRSQCVGLDILLGPSFRNPTVLEVNAFGDLLPGITHNGLNTYETQASGADWTLCQHTRRTTLLLGNKPIG